jgi:ribose transport system permease protein
MSATGESAAKDPAPPEQSAIEEVGGGASADRAPTPASRRYQELARGRLRRLGIVVPFVILFIVLSFASSGFLTKANLLNILDQQAATLVIAAAGTLVLVSGGIDLSVGAVYGLAAVVSGKLLGHVPAGFAILGGVLAGTLVGAVNGFIATVLRINALITTLAMSFVVAGIASLVTQGNLLVLSNDTSFGDFSNTSIIGVNSSTWVMVIVVVVLGLLLARTTIGRYMYASGGNAEAARIAGVRVNLTRIIAFALSGGAAAVGGIIDSSRVLSADGTNNDQLTFTVLAGIVVGGTSILGGEGVVWRTVVGVLLIALIGNGYDLLGLNPLYEQITLGVIMILAVGLDAWSRQARH